MSLETNTHNLDQQISPRGPQNAAIAYLGQLALSKPALADLFTDATTLISQLLPAEIALLWELEPDMEHLSLRIISGQKEGTEASSRIPVEADSLEGLALRSQNPILVNTIGSEARFQSSRILLENGAVSGVAIRIGIMEQPFGVLEVFSPHLQPFSQDDIHFLQSIANIIASSIDLKRQQEKWTATEQSLRQQLAKAQSGPPTSQMQWERYEIKNRLVESRERERLRLAQELHDIPIQDLYGLMYQLDDLRDIVKDADGSKTLDQFNDTLHRVVNNLRAICGELRPPSLSPFGLEVAIRDHVAKMRSQNPDLSIHLDLMRDHQILSDSLRLCLFRIYQQSINNVVRHAQATEIYIRFRWDEEIIILEVEDNGDGFEMPSNWLELVRQEHFGLVGLAERVESVSGKLEIISSIGHGTMVRAIVPRR
jgi:signal transduction histidine kinase